MLGTCRNGNIDRNLHLKRRLKMLNGRQEDNSTPLSNNGIRRAFVEIAHREKTPENARLLTECLRSYIIQQPHAVKRSEVFLNWAHKNILFVHSFCCQVAEVTKKYILDHYMIEILKTYVRLECEFSKESEERVAKLLWSIYRKYCFYSINQSSESTVWEMIYRFLTFELPANIPKLNAILEIIKDFLPAEPSHPEFPYYTKNTIHRRTVEPPNIALIDLTAEDEIESKKRNGLLSITRTRDNLENNLDEELSARLGQLPKLSRQSRTEVPRPSHCTRPRPRGPITRTNLRVNTMINLVDDSDDEDNELAEKSNSRPQGNIAMHIQDDDVTEILTPRQDVVDLTEGDDFCDDDNIVSSRPVTKHETVDSEDYLANETGSSGFTQSVEDKDLQTLPSGRTSRMNYKVRETEWPKNYEGACTYQERRFVVGNALWRNDISRTHREDVEVPFSASDCSQMSNSSQDYIPVERELCLINDSKSRVLQTSKKDSSTQTLQLLDEGCQTDETIYFCHSSQSSDPSLIMQSGSVGGTLNHRTSGPIEKSNKVQKSVIDLHESFCLCQKEIKKSREQPVLNRSFERVTTFSGNSLEEASLLAANQTSRSLVQQQPLRTCKNSCETNIDLKDVSYNKSDRVQKSVISNKSLCECCHHQKGSETNHEEISVPRPFQRIEKLSKDYLKQDATLFRRINSSEISEQARKLPMSHEVVETLDSGLNKHIENINIDETDNDTYHYQKESGNSFRETILSRPFERFGNMTADLSKEGLSQQSKALQLNKRCEKLSVDVTEKDSSSPQSSSPAASCVNTNTPLSCTDENSVDLPTTVFLDIRSPKQNLDHLQTPHDRTKSQSNTYCKESVMNAGRSDLTEAESKRSSKTKNFPGNVYIRENSLSEDKTKYLTDSQNRPIGVDTLESNTSESFLTSDTAVEDTSQAKAAKSSCQEIAKSMNLIFERAAETKTKESILWMRRTTTDLVSSSTDVGQPASPSDLVKKVPANKLPYDSSLQPSSVMTQSTSQWANHHSQVLSEDVSKNLQIESADSLLKSSVMLSSASETERSVRKLNPENSVSSTNTTAVSPHVADSLVLLEDQSSSDIPSHKDCIKSLDSKVPTDIANSTIIPVHSDTQISLREFSTVKSTDANNSQVGAESVESPTSSTRRDSQNSLFMGSVDELVSEVNLQKSDKTVNTSDSQVVADFEKSSASCEAQDQQSSASESLFSNQINEGDFQIRTDFEKSASHEVSTDEQIHESKAQLLQDVVKSSTSPFQPDCGKYLQKNSAHESSNVLDAGVEKSFSNSYHEPLTRGGFSSKLFIEDDLQGSGYGVKVSASPMELNIETSPKMSSLSKLSDDVHLQIPSDVAKSCASPTEQNLQSPTHGSSLDLLNREINQLISEFSESNGDHVEQELHSSSYCTTDSPQKQLNSALQKSVSDASNNKAESQVAMNVSETSNRTMQRDPEADAPNCIANLSFAEDSHVLDYVKIDSLTPPLETSEGKSVNEDDSRLSNDSDLKSDLLTSPLNNSEAKPISEDDAQIPAAAERLFTSIMQQGPQTSSHKHSTVVPDSENNAQLADLATSSSYESSSSILGNDDDSRTPNGIVEHIPNISNDDVSEQVAPQPPVNDTKSPKRCVEGDVPTSSLEGIAKIIEPSEEDNSQLPINDTPKSCIEGNVPTLSLEFVAKLVNKVDLKVHTVKSTISHRSQTPHEISADKRDVLSEGSIRSLQSDLQTFQEDSAGELTKICDLSTSLVQPNIQTCLQDQSPDMPRNEGDSQERLMNKDELKVTVKFEKSAVRPECSTQDITGNNTFSKGDSLLELKSLTVNLGNNYSNDSTVRKKNENLSSESDVVSPVKELMSDKPSPTLNMANLCSQITTQDCSAEEPALTDSCKTKTFSSIDDKSNEGTLASKVDVLTSTDLVTSSGIEECRMLLKQDLSNNEVCQEKKSVSVTALNNSASAKEQVKHQVQLSLDDISEIKESDLTTEYTSSSSVSENLEATSIPLLRHLPHGDVSPQVIESDMNNEAPTEVTDSEIAFSSTKSHASAKVALEVILPKDVSEISEREKYKEKEINSPRVDFSLGKENTVCTVDTSSLKSTTELEHSSAMLLQEYPHGDVLQIQKIDVTNESANSEELVDHPEIPVQDFPDHVKDSGEGMKFSDSIEKLEDNSVQVLQKSSNKNITRFEENNICSKYESAPSSLENHLESAVPKSQYLCHEDVSKVEDESIASDPACIVLSKERTDSSPFEPDDITTENSFDRTEKTLTVAQTLSQNSLSEGIPEVRRNNVTAEYGDIIVRHEITSEVGENSELETTPDKQNENQAEYSPQSDVTNDITTESLISEKISSSDGVSREKDSGNTCLSALAAYYQYVSLFLEEERKASGADVMIPDPFQIFTIAATQQIDSERSEHVNDVKQELSSKERVEQEDLPRTVNHIDEDALLEEPEGYLGSYKEMDEELLLREESEKDRPSSCPQIEIAKLSENDSNKTVVGFEASVDATEKNVESETKDVKHTSNAYLKSANMSEVDTNKIIAEIVDNETEVGKHTNQSEMVTEEMSSAYDRTEGPSNNVPESENITSISGPPAIKILSNVVLKPGQWPASVVPQCLLQNNSEMAIPDDVHRNSPQIEDPGSNQLDPVGRSEQEESGGDGFVAVDNAIETASVSHENNTTTATNTFRDLREVETLVYTPGYSMYTQEQLMILKEDSSRTRDDPRKDIYALKYNSDVPESDVLNLSSSVKDKDSSNYVTVSSITETRRQEQIVEPTVFAENPIQSVQPTGFVEQPIQSNEIFLSNNVLDWRRSGASEVTRVVPTIVNPLNLILDAENSRRVQDTIDTCSPSHFSSTCQGIGGAILKTVVEPSKVPCNYFQGDHSCSDNKLMTLAGIALQYGNNDSADPGDITVRHGNSEATDSSDSEMKLKIDEGRSSPETVESNWKAARNKVPVTPKRTNKKRKIGIRLTPKRCRTKAELKCMPSEEQSSNTFSDDDTPLTVRLQRKANSQDTAKNAKNIPHTKNGPSPSRIGSSKRGRPKSSVRKGKKPPARGADSKSGTSIRRRSSPELQEQVQKGTSPEPAYTSKLRSRSQSTSDKEKVKDETNTVHSKQKSRKGSINCEENIKSPKLVKPSAETSKKKECVIPVEKLPHNTLEVSGNRTSDKLPSKPSLSLSEETFSKHTLASSPPKKRYFLLEKKNPYLEERTKRLEERLKGKDSFDQNNKGVNISHTDFHYNSDAVAFLEFKTTHVQEITLPTKSGDSEVRICSDVPPSSDDLPLSQLKISVLPKTESDQAKENVKLTTSKEVKKLSYAENKDDNVHLSKQDSVKSVLDFTIYNNELDNETNARLSLEHDENSNPQSTESKKSKSVPDSDHVSIAESLVESSEYKSNKVGKSNVIPNTELKPNIKSDSLGTNDPELTPQSAEKKSPILQNSIETIKYLEVKIENYDFTTKSNSRKIPGDESPSDITVNNSEEETSVISKNDSHMETQSNTLIKNNKEYLCEYPEGETHGDMDSVVENDTHLKNETVLDSRSMKFEKASTSSYTLSKPISIDAMRSEEQMRNTGNITDKEHCPSAFPSKVVLSETVNFGNVVNNLVEEFDGNFSIISNEVVIGENSTQAVHDEKEQILEAPKDDSRSNSLINEYDINVKTNTTSERCSNEYLNPSSSVVCSSESSTNDPSRHPFSIAKIMQSSNIDSKFAIEVKIDSQLPETNQEESSAELFIPSTTAHTIECGITDVKASDDIQSIKPDNVSLSLTEESVNDIKDKIAVEESPEHYSKVRFDVECNQNEVNYEEAEKCLIAENRSETKVDNHVQQKLSVSENSYVVQDSESGIIERENSDFETTSEDFFDISDFEIIDETSQESIEVTSDTICNKSLIEDSSQSSSEVNCVGDILDIHFDNVSVSYPDSETCEKELVEKTPRQICEKQSDIVESNCCLTRDESIKADDTTQSEYSRSGVDHPDLCGYECEIEVHSENKMDEFNEALAHLNTTQDNILTNENSTASTNGNNNVDENSGVNFQVASEIVIHENTSVKVVSYRETSVHNDLDSNSWSTDVTISQDSGSEIEMKRNLGKKRRRHVSSRNLLKEDRRRDDNKQDKLKNILEIKSSSTEGKPSKTTTNPKDAFEIHKKSTIEKVKEPKDRVKDRSTEKYQRPKTEKSEKSTTKTSLDRDIKNEGILDIHKDQRQLSKKYDSESKERKRSRSSREKSGHSEDKGRRRSYDKGSKIAENEVKKSGNSDSLQNKLNSDRTESDKDEKSKLSQVSSSKESSKTSRDDRRSERKSKREGKSTNNESRISEASKKHDPKYKLNKDEKTESETAANHGLNEINGKNRSSKHQDRNKDQNHTHTKFDDDLKSNKLSNQLEEAKSSLGSPKSDAFHKGSGDRVKKYNDGLRRSERFNPPVEVKISSDALKSDKLCKDQKKASKKCNDKLETKENSMAPKFDKTNPAPADEAKKSEEDVRRTEIRNGPLVQAKSSTDSPRPDTSGKVQSKKDKKVEEDKLKSKTGSDISTSDAPSVNTVEECKNPDPGLNGTEIYIPLTGIKSSSDSPRLDTSDKVQGKKFKKPDDEQEINRSRSSSKCDASSELYIPLGKAKSSTNIARPNTPGKEQSNRFKKPEDELVTKKSSDEPKSDTLNKNLVGEAKKADEGLRKSERCSSLLEVEKSSYSSKLDTSSKGQRKKLKKSENKLDDRSSDSFISNSRSNDIVDETKNCDDGLRRSERYSPLVETGRRSDSSTCDTLSKGPSKKLEKSGDDLERKRRSDGLKSVTVVKDVTEAVRKAVDGLGKKENFSPLVEGNKSTSTSSKSERKKTEKSGIELEIQRSSVGSKSSTSNKKSNDVKKSDDGLRRSERNISLTEMKTNNDNLKSETSIKDQSKASKKFDDETKVSSGSSGLDASFKSKPVDEDQQSDDNLIQSERYRVDETKSSSDSSDLLNKSAKGQSKKMKKSVDELETKRSSDCTRTDTSDKDRSGKIKKSDDGLRRSERHTPLVENKNEDDSFRPDTLSKDKDKKNKSPDIEFAIKGSNVKTGSSSDKPEKSDDGLRRSERCTPLVEAKRSGESVKLDGLTEDESKGIKTPDETAKISQNCTSDKFDDGLRRSERNNALSEAKRSCDNSEASTSSKVHSKRFKKSDNEQEAQRSIESSRSDKSNKDPVVKVKKSTQGLRRSERNSPLAETRKGHNSSSGDKSSEDQSNKCGQTVGELNQRNSQVCGQDESGELAMADVLNNKDQNQKAKKVKVDELRKSVLHNQESNKPDRDSSNIVNKNENKKVEKSDESRCEHLQLAASENNRSSRLVALNISQKDKVERTDVEMRASEPKKHVVTKHGGTPKRNTPSKDPSYNVEKSYDDLRRSDSPKIDKPDKGESHQAEKTDGKLKSRRREKSSKMHDQNISKASKKEKVEQKNAVSKHVLNEQPGKQSDVNNKESDPLRNENKDSKYEQKRESSVLLEEVIDRTAPAKKNILDNKLCSGNPNEIKSKLKEPTDKKEDHRNLNDQKKGRNDSQSEKDEETDHKASSRKVLDSLSNEQSAVNESSSSVGDHDKVTSGKENCLIASSDDTVHVENQSKESTEKRENCGSNDNGIKKTDDTIIKNKTDGKQVAFTSSDNKAEILFKTQTSSNGNHPGERKLYIMLDNRAVNSATRKSKKRKSDKCDELDSSSKSKKAKAVIIEEYHNKIILDDIRKNRKRSSSLEYIKENKKVCVEPIPFQVLNDFGISCIKETYLQFPPEHVDAEITSPITETNTTIAENNSLFERGEENSIILPLSRSDTSVGETKSLFNPECSHALPALENNTSATESNCSPNAKSDVLPVLESGMSVPERSLSISESSCLPDAQNNVSPDSESGMFVPEINPLICESSCVGEGKNDVFPSSESGIPVYEINSSVRDSSCLPEAGEVLPNSGSDISVTEINSSESNKSVIENNASLVQSNILSEVEMKQPSPLGNKEPVTETNLLNGAKSNTLPVPETTWTSDTKSENISGLGSEKDTVGVGELSVVENNISLTESSVLSDVEITALPTSIDNKFIAESNMLSDTKGTSENNTSVSDYNWISDATNNALIGLESDKPVSGVRSLVTESNSLSVTENNMSATESTFSSEIDALDDMECKVSTSETNLLSDAVINALATSNSTLIIDTNLYPHAETDTCVTDTNKGSEAFPVADNSTSVTETLSNTETNTLTVIENKSCLNEKETLSVTKNEDCLSNSQNNSDDISSLDTQSHSSSESASKEVASQLSQSNSKKLPEVKNGTNGNKNSLSDYLSSSPLIYTSSSTKPFTQKTPDQQPYENVYSGVVDSSQSIPEQQPYENVYTGVLDFFGITETVETTPLPNPDLLDFAFENVVTTSSSSFSNSEMQLGFRSDDMKTFHGSQFNPLYQGSSGDGIAVSSVASSLSQSSPYQTIPVKASQGLIESSVSCASLCPTKQIGMPQYEDHSYADVVETIKKFQKSVQGSPVPAATEPVVVARTSAINSLIMETGGVEYTNIASPNRAINSEIRNTSIETAQNSSGIYQDKSSNCMTVSSVESTISQTTSYQTIPLCTSQDLPVSSINSATLQEPKENPDTDHTSTMDSMIGGIGGLKSDSELVETTLDIENPSCSIGSISGSLESDSVLDESNLQPALDLFSFQNDRSMYNDIRFLKNIIEEVTGGDSEPDLSYSFEMTDAGPRLLETEKNSVAVPSQVKKTKKQVQQMQPAQPVLPSQSVHRSQSAQPRQTAQTTQPVQPTHPVHPKLLEIPTRTFQRKKMHPPPRRKETQPIVRSESNIRVKPPQELVVQGPKATPKEDVRKSPRIHRSANYESEVCDSLAEARLRAEKYSMPVVDPHPDDLTSRPSTKISIPTSTPPSTCRESPVRLESRRATRDYQQAVKRSQHETKIEKFLDPFDQLKNEHPTNPFFKQRNNSKSVNTKKRNDNKRLKTHHSEGTGQSSPFDDTSDDICWPPVGNNVKYRSTHQSVKSKSEPHKLGGFEEPYRETLRSAADDRIPHSFVREETVKPQLNRKTDPHTPVIGPPVKSGSKSAADRRDDDQYDWLKKFPKELQKRGRIDSIRLHGANYGT